MALAKGSKLTLYFVSLEGKDGLFPFRASSVKKVLHRVRKYFMYFPDAVVTVSAFPSNEAVFHGPVSSIF